MTKIKPEKKVNSGSNTAVKLRKKKVPQGKPFAKGNDPRRNLRGRPKSFDQLRALGQELSHEWALGDDGKPLLAPDKKPMTITEAIMRQMMRDPKQYIDWLYITYGKPSERHEVTGKDGAPLGVPPLDMKALKEYLSDGDLEILQQAAEVMERAQRDHDLAVQKGD